MKRLSKTLIYIASLGMFFSIAGCNSSKATMSEFERKTRDIYESGLREGSIKDQTYEGWLESIRGKDGQDGHTPVITIGENGNWFIDGVDTGINAKGPKGDQGAQGIPGQDGTSVLTGNGVPISEQGKNGDSYIDLVTWDYYVKESGTWVLKGNIKGEDLTDDNLQQLAFFPTGNNSYYVAAGNSTMLSNIIIPETYKGLPVTGIMANGFRGSNAKSISIPESVTSIGDYAFGECSKLTSITIFDSVTSIGENAFRGCTSLTSVTIGNSVTSIGSYAFYNCSSLTSIVIPDSVTSIGSNAFFNCFSLTSVTIGNSVTSIGSNAFYQCTSLTSIVFPDSVTSIDTNVFYHCTSLTSVTIGNSVTSISERLFYYCFSLTSIVIPDSVTSIDKDALLGCTSLIYVFYLGTESEWSGVSVGIRNEQLTNYLYFYSETKPEEEGNYWHYVDGVPTIWE